MVTILRYLAEAQADPDSATREFETAISATKKLVLAKYPVIDPSELLLLCTKEAPSHSQAEIMVVALAIATGYQLVLLQHYTEGHVEVQKNFEYFRLYSSVKRVFINSSKMTIMQRLQLLGTKYLMHLSFGIPAPETRDALHKACQSMFRMYNEVDWRSRNFFTPWMNLSACVLLLTETTTDIVEMEYFNLPFPSDPGLLKERFGDLDSATQYTSRLQSMHEQYFRHCCKHYYDARKGPVAQAFKLIEDVFFCLPQLQNYLRHLDAGRPISAECREYLRLGISQMTAYICIQLEEDIFTRMLILDRISHFTNLLKRIVTDPVQVDLILQFQKYTTSMVCFLRHEHKEKQKLDALCAEIGHLYQKIFKVDSLCTETKYGPNRLNQTEVPAPTIADTAALPTLLTRSKHRTPGKRQRKWAEKSRTGCQTCRQRRVKCGEERPTCSRCDRGFWQCTYLIGPGKPRRFL